MTDPSASLDLALAAYEGSTLEEIREQISFHPVDLEAYRETFLQMGSALPPGLEALLRERGLLRAPELGTPFELPSGSSGLRMADPEELFSAFLYLDEAIDAGIEEARGWRIFALLRPGSFEEGYFLKEGPKEGEGGEAAVGYYDAGGRPQAELASVGGLLEAYAAALDIVRLRGDRVAILRSLRALKRSQSQGSSDPGWRRIWSEHERGKLEWSLENASRFAPVLAGTDDEAILKKLLSRIHAELDGHGGRGVDPLLAERFEKGAWPSDLPGPLELLARLPAEGRGGLRGVVRFCLAWSGLEPREGPLAEGLAVLEALCDGEVEEERRREALRACAELARPARGIAIGVEEAEAFYARALTWSLGALSAAKARHVAAIAIRLSALAWTEAGRAAGLRVPETVRPFGMPALFQKLSALARGELAEEPGLLRVRQATPIALPVHDALRDWLEAHEGSQREKLAELKEGWGERLRSAAAEDRERCARLIKKKLNSKKLRADRDAWLSAQSAD